MRVFTHHRITIAIAVVALLGAVTFGLSLRTRSQQLNSSTLRVSDELIQQIERSSDQPLRVVENDDSPLRILEAKVKEISGSDFKRLTGKKTDLSIVCSVPEVRLLNSSGKAVTGFVLVIRDPISKTTRGIVQSKVMIAGGGIYTAARHNFIRPEWISSTGKDGQVNPRFARPEINSEKHWIVFAPRSDLFVTVARVNFQDGSSWTLKEGGDIR